MSQGRWVNGELVTSVYVVNQTTSSGSSTGGVTADEVTGIVSGYIEDSIGTDIIPRTSGVYDLGSAAMPWKDGYFTSGSLYLSNTHLFVDDGANLCIDNEINIAQPLTTNSQVDTKIAAPKDSYKFVDDRTDAVVTLSVRDGGLIVTDPFNESVSNVDLGGTTPDPGTVTNLFLNGTGKYTANAVGQPNNNGLVTLEYINTPGQFFVINDAGGPGFGYGDRQCFGLVRETIYDRTDLDGAPGVFDGGSSGGWSLSPFWYYTGSSPNSYPYIWTTYASTSQTPGGGGNSPTGAFGGQSTQKLWWDLCIKAGSGHGIRVGIANGTLTQQDGADYGNRLVCQMLVTDAMVAHSDFSNMPTAVRNNGAGWYTCYATANDYENMGQFPDGKDKGYRFRWSTFGNTALNQLPHMTGVSSNDQITAAAGQSHYVVYNINATDKTAANSVLASGTLGPNNRLYASGTTIDVLQFNNPYGFPNTASGDVYSLGYQSVSAVQASPLFVTYPVSTGAEIRAAGIAVAPLQTLHQEVCDQVRNAVTAYYLVRDFNAANTVLINAKLATASQAALGGQLINTYDAVTAIAPDDSNPEGVGGEVLFPAALKSELLATLSLYMATLPDN
jgi:hypothetical protein